MPELIDQSSFQNWKEHPVTLEFFTILKALDEHLLASQNNPEVFLSMDSRVAMARIYGSREMIDRILHMTFEDVKTEAEEENNEEL